jgi:hypothetical protein
MRPRVLLVDDVEANLVVLETHSTTWTAIWSRYFAGAARVGC